MSFVTQNTNAQDQSVHSVAEKRSARQRLVVELGEKSAADLEKLLVSESTNKTTIVNRAIQLFELIRDLENRGGTVLLDDPDRGQARLALLRG